jgi:hypothetical protein
MKIKLNKDLLQHKAGAVLNIRDNKGIPLDRYWRRRLFDAARDNCIEVVKEYKKPEKTKETTKKKIRRVNK